MSTSACGFPWRLYLELALSFLPTNSITVTALEVRRSVYMSSMSTLHQLSTPKAWGLVPTVKIAYPRGISFTPKRKWPIFSVRINIPLREQIRHIRLHACKKDVKLMHLVVAPLDPRGLSYAPQTAIGLLTTAALCNPSSEAIRI